MSELLPGVAMPAMTGVFKEETKSSKDETDGMGKAGACQRYPWNNLPAGSS